MINENSLKWSLITLNIGFNLDNLSQVKTYCELIVKVWIGDKDGEIRLVRFGNLAKHALIQVNESTIMPLNLCHNIRA